MSQSERTQPAEDSLAWGAKDAAPENRDLTGMNLGDFRVERMLGRGGMGEVYLATQISLNRQVALKVLRPDLLTKENYLKRFEVEATTVAKLNHPNIVHVYTLGNVDGIRFIAMEYVQGTNLRDYLAKKGALDIPLALSIMKQAATAVGAAGEIGLVHRDIKPENLMVTKRGQVKVADFGLCRNQDTAPLNLTQPGVTMGTPLYMSPEQAQGKPCDHRSDLYSLGATFYHMLAGCPPFRAETPIAVALKHLKDQPISMMVLRPEIPPEIDRLVLKLMEKDPANRFQSAAEMLKELAKAKEAINATTGATAAPDISTGIPTANGDPGARSGVSGTEARTVQGSTSLALSGGREPLARPSSKPWIAVACLCLIAGLACGWFMRPTDLLAANAPEPPTPGLWIAPDWSAIPNQPTAEAQFDYAMFRAQPEEAEAAWVAVAGYHPRSHEWIAQSYIQLARHLLRNRDADRLTPFAQEIGRWSEKEHEQELAAIIQAGVKALNGDVEGVTRDFEQTVKPSSLVDPALAELGAEVTLQAMEIASRRPAPPAFAKIQAARFALVEALYRTAHSQAGRARPRSR
jgi:serine/threonine-protein kinase